MKSPEGAVEVAVVVVDVLGVAEDVLGAHVTEVERAAMRVVRGDILLGTVDMGVNLVMGNVDITEGG